MEQKERIIKFRGLGRNDGIWKYGFYVERKAFDYGLIYDDIGVGHKVKKETVGQFTGIKDRNGVEIYEGDIMQWRPDENDNDYDEERERYYVIFRDGAFKTVWKGDPEIEAEYIDMTIDLEVIGNLYQNPELLIPQTS